MVSAKPDRNQGEDTSLTKRAGRKNGGPARQDDEEQLARPKQHTQRPNKAGDIDVGLVGRGLHHHLELGPGRGQRE